MLEFESSQSRSTSITRLSFEYASIHLHCRLSSHSSCRLSSSHYANFSVWTRSKIIEQDNRRQTNQTDRMKPFEFNRRQTASTQTTRFLLNVLREYDDVPQMEEQITTVRYFGKTRLWCQSSKMHSTYMLHFAGV